MKSNGWVHRYPRKDIRRPVICSSVEKLYVMKWICRSSKTRRFLSCSPFEVLVHAQLLSNLPLLSPEWVARAQGCQLIVQRTLPATSQQKWTEELSMVSSPRCCGSDCSCQCGSFSWFCSVSTLPWEATAIWTCASGRSSAISRKFIFLPLIPCDRFHCATLSGSVGYRAISKCCSAWGTFSAKTGQFPWFSTPTWRNIRTRQHSSSKGKRGLLKMYFQLTLNPAMRF